MKICEMKTWWWVQTLFYESENREHHLLLLFYLDLKFQNVVKSLEIN